MRRAEGRRPDHFLALAEQLDEPLATRDEALADGAAKHSAVAVLPLRG